MAQDGRRYFEYKLDHPSLNLIGCGLRRAELVGLRTGDFQVREDHCVIADLVGKGKHIRTVPVPLWEIQTTERYLGCKQRLSQA